jgi:hypothetical protein
LPVSPIGLPVVALAARQCAGAHSRCREPQLLTSAVYLVSTVVLSKLAQG